jgi:hypothetical protein
MMPVAMECVSVTAIAFIWLEARLAFPSRRMIMSAMSLPPSWRSFPRRDILAKGGALLAGAALLHASRLAYAFPSVPGETVVPWLDQPPENPVPQVVANQLVWEDVDTWITPNEKFFSIAHYDRPVLDDKSWKLEIVGSVERPLTLDLSDLKKRPRQEVVFTVASPGSPAVSATPSGRAHHWPRF